MKNWIENTDIRRIWLQTIGLGLGFSIVIALIGSVIFEGDPPEVFTRLLLIIVGLLFILPGSAQIIKQESPGGIRGIIRGKTAVMSGWFWIIFCLLVIFGVFYDMILAGLYPNRRIQNE